MPPYRAVFLVSAALLFSVSLAASDVQSLSDVISTQDAARLRKLFTSAEPYSDLTTAFYIVRGLKALKHAKKDDVLLENACDYGISHLDTKNLSSVYLVSSIAKDVGPECVGKVLAESSSIQTLISGQSLDERTTIMDLHQTVTSVANLGLEFDSERVLSLLTTVLDNEESIFQMGMVFLTAAQLPESVDPSSIFEQIEDVIAQADETPSALFYDSLETTSTVVTGIFAMATRMGEAPAITPEQATKFGNYLISNKYTANLTTASQVLSAAGALDGNKYVVPSTLLLVSPRYVTRDHPDVKVRLSTMLGSPVSAGFLVQLKTVEDSQGREIKKSQPVKMEEGGIFSYNLFDDVTDPGVYTLTFSSQSSSPSPISALTNIQLQVTLSYTVTVGSAKFSLVDREQGSTTRSVSLDYPNSKAAILDADQHSKVVLNFHLLNKATKKRVIVHQAFVRLSLVSMEIFFVATPDKTSGEYTFELDMTSSASDFGTLSGSYAVSLIVGDFSLENPFSWDIGTVNLVFSGTSAPPAEVEDFTYKAKPVIEHMFRPDEKLPPKIISTTFTVLALSPLAILLIMWLVLGANISGIGTGGLWTVVFHVGLGGILFLYYIFWIKLNMFDTFKLLVLLSVPTFVAGNRMLRKIAKSNKLSA